MIYSNSSTTIKMVNQVSNIDHSRNLDLGNIISIICIFIVFYLVPNLQVLAIYKVY